jgi:hypothetical protein
MRVQKTAASILSMVLSIALGLPLETWAQNTSQPGAQPQPAQSNDIQAPPAPESQQPNAPATQPQINPQKPPAAGGATVNPSQPPLQPVTTYPDAAGGQQQTQPGVGTSQAGVPESPQPKTQQTEQPQNEPQGAATAEKVPTAGGAAAKPAGVAVAPAKQHQARSLLIKLGAVAAGAVAAGTIYAISRGTSSTPPGANSPGAVQKRSR